MKYLIVCYARSGFQAIGHVDLNVKLIKFDVFGGKLQETKSI